jgi:hypothetical protein
VASVDWSKIKTVGEACAVLRHDCEDTREKQTHTNPHLNPEFTKRNSGLHTKYAEAKERYTKRLEDVTGGKWRKDAVVAVGFSIPAPEGLKEQDEEEWFSKVYSLLCERYGEANIACYAIHRDEIHEYVDSNTKRKVISRPHAQGIIVPEVDGRLCAKEVVTRGRMREINSAIDKMTTEDYGLHWVTGKGVKGPSVEIVKASSAKLEVEQTQKEAQAVKEELQAIVSGYNWVSQVNPEDSIPSFKRKKGLIGNEVVSMSSDDWEKVANTIKAQKGVSEALRGLENSQGGKLYLEGEKALQRASQEQQLAEIQWQSANARHKNLDDREKKLKKVEKEFSFREDRLRKRERDVKEKEDAAKRQTEEAERRAAAAKKEAEEARRAADEAIKRVARRKAMIDEQEEELRKMAKEAKQLVIDLHHINALPSTELAREGELTKKLMRYDRMKEAKKVDELEDDFEMDF